MPFVRHVIPVGTGGVLSGAVCFVSKLMVLQPENVIEALARYASALRAQGVVSLVLFGSVARREARPDSDVDLVVEFDRPVGYFALFRLQDQLAEWLGRPVDLMTADSLRPELRERVLREGLRAA